MDQCAHKNRNRNLYFAKVKGVNSSNDFAYCVSLDTQRFFIERGISREYLKGYIIGAIISKKYNLHNGIPNNMPCFKKQKFKNIEFKPIDSHMLESMFSENNFRELSNLLC